MNIEQGTPNAEISTSPQLRHLLFLVLRFCGSKFKYPKFHKFRLRAGIRGVKQKKGNVL